MILNNTPINDKYETINKNDRTCRDVKTHNVCKQGQDGTAVLFQTTYMYITKTPFSKAL